MVELAIRDLKAGVGLRHHPSGKINANAAWLVIATLWLTTCCAGSPPSGWAPAKSWSWPRPAPHLLSLPGRLTRSARRWTLHLPADWPWAPWFELALARLRCVTYAT